MAAKSTSKSATSRRPAASKSKLQSTNAKYDVDDEALEDALAYEHDFDEEGFEDDEEPGMIARASAGVRELTREREGRIVVGALVGGFAIGVVIGGIIARSHAHEQSWSEKLMHEGLGRRLLDKLGNAIPESISDRLHR